MVKIAKKYMKFQLVEGIGKISQVTPTIAKTDLKGV
jgi:hypothetical protein